jgi:uncharacterized repeat protein (TIGR01451 family)
MNTLVNKSNRGKFFLQLVTCLMVWLALIPSISHAQVAVPTTAGPPFFCDARFYQSRADTTAGNPTSNRTYFVRYDSLAAGTVPDNPYGLNYFAGSLNALGFNPRDGYLYALSSGAVPNNQLFRIGQTGVELVGTIAGLPATFISTGGVFDKQGRFYFAGQNGAGNIDPSIIYRIDNVPTTGAAALTIARSYALTPTIPNIGDFAFSDATDGINGLLYGAVGGQLFRIQLSDVAATAVATAAAVTPGVGGIGSAFYDRPTNQFYVFNNGAVTFSQINNFAGPGAATSVNTAVAAPTFIPALFTNSSTDGTSCVLATVQEGDINVRKTVVPLTPVTLGQTVTFTVVVGNLGPSPAQSTTIAELLPAGLSFVSSNATAGTITAVPGTWTIPSLPAFTSQTLTIVATVNAAGTTTSSFANVASYRGSNLVGTTTVVPLPDTTPGNNTATATPTVTVSASLSISKTDGTTTAVAGGTTVYTVTVSNLSGFNVANAVLRDPAAAGLSCTATTPTCVVTVGTGTCPATGVAAGQLSAANLQGAGGVVIPQLNVGASMAFRITCRVTATGL